MCFDVLCRIDDVPALMIALLGVPTATHLTVAVSPIQGTERHYPAEVWCVVRIGMPSGPSEKGETK